MGKGGSAQQIVNEYRMSLQYGICSGPAVLREIFIDNRSIWSGRMEDSGWIDVSIPYLFGGPKKEGGIEGSIYFMPGKPDQVMPNSLAARFGLTSQNCPAFRGVATLFFVGSEGSVYDGYGGILGEQNLTGNDFNGSHGPSGGFLWTSNSPFVRPVKVKVERTPIGLDPQYAMIGSSVSVSFDGYVATADGVVKNLADGVATAVGKHTLSYTKSDIENIRTFKIDGTTIVLTPYITDQYGILREGNTINVNGTIVTMGLSGSVRAGDAIVGINGSVFSYSVDAGANLNANPAHMIFENLTNTEWGMAAPSYLIDVANFNDVAQRLFNEQFMLSFFWTQQDAVETYTGEILNHILCTLFVNPRTGLLSLKLFRDDYDFDSLPQINPSNAKLKSFKRKLYGETINEINVSWTNPETEQTQTVTAHDLANMEIQGSPVSDTRNYYGIRSGDLAAQVAARDSRTASAPLATLEAELDRTQWSLLPGSVVRVNWPRYRLADVVCRVIKIAYGKPGNPAITVTLMEDIFSISKAAMIPTPVTQWQGVSVDPAPMQFEQIITLPYYLAAKEVMNEPPYPSVMAGVLAYQPGGSTSSYDLYAERLQANGSTAWQSVGTKTLLGRATMLTPLYAEATSSVTGLPLTGDARGPIINGLVVIGEGGDADQEIALLQGYDGSKWTVNRGVLDTVPKAWPIGTPVWFLPQNAIVGDTIEIRAAGESPEYKLITRTSKGVLSIANAPIITALMTPRPHAPLRPANVKINGVAFGDYDATGATQLVVTWSNRNRLNEDTLIVPWDAASNTPEYLQMAIVTVFRANGDKMITWRGIYADTSLMIPIADIQQEQSVFVRVTAERSGIASIQGYGMWVRNIPQIANPAAPPVPVEPSPPAPPGEDALPTPIGTKGPDGDNIVRPTGYDLGEWAEYRQ